MPKMNGYEATKKIRESEKNTSEHLMIIPLTANAIKGDKKCIEVGMEEYLSKPVRINELKASIEKVNSNKTQ